MTRTFELTTPLGKDVLLFHRMSAHDEISRLSEYRLDMLSDKGDIKLDDILGKNVTVKAELPDNKWRYFNGFVTRFSQGGNYGRYFTYHATVRPWLWMLTRTANCRIFQKMTVPDILKKVFNDHAQIADTKFELSGTYEVWDYCVQYRETDFNFVSRLMEQEGIYYYLKHQDGRHTAVFADSYSAHAPFAGYDQIPFIPHDRAARPEQERVTDWHLEREIQSGRYVIDDYDFERPSVELKVNTKTKRDNAHANYEIYDYPGEYVKKSEGEHYVKSRMEEVQAQYELAHGQCNARGLCAGHLFKLTGQPRDDQNREYLVVAAEHHAEYSQYESIEGGGTSYDCSFTVLHSKQAFRPARLTPKPTVQGPQTAVVVGPGGDEIYTDKYGRVKVQFHWDRLGQKNENSSCWMRVSHPWAGKNWGMVSTPRIGQEVIVDFLEGDPDQPIITGRVYNAEQMPPWDLPANMTQTGILSRSSKGGSGANANAIRFEDKKGEEQVWLHAEKNQDIEVEHDETHWVGNDRTKTIDHDETSHIKHDRTETVDNDETVTVHHDRTERVDHDESISIGRDRYMLIEHDKFEKVQHNKAIQVAAAHSESIGSSMTINVASTLTESVGINYAETVGGAMELTVGAALAITVGAAMAETIAGAKVESIGGAKSESIGANRSLNVGGNVSETMGKDRVVTVAKDNKTSVGGQSKLSVTKEYIVNAKKIQLVAEEEIQLKVGSAEILMKKNGDITMKGNKINIKGSGDVIVKGSKIAEN